MMHAYILRARNCDDMHADACMLHECISVYVVQIAGVCTRIYTDIRKCICIVACIYMCMYACVYIYMYMNIYMLTCYLNACTSGVS